MAPRFGTVRACSGEALANFSWRDYAPFAWLLAAEFLFLVLASNLGSTWGMATAGRIAHLVGGDGATRNPGFFVHLPAIFAYVEVGIYTLVGALVLPLAIAGVLAPFEPSLKDPAVRSARVRGAILPTFFGLVLYLGVAILWQWAIGAVIAPFFIVLMGKGFNAMVAIWAVSAILGFVFVAAVYYVPIVALRRGGSPGGAVVGGLREGLPLLFGTFLYLLLFSIPALVMQAIVQLFATMIVVRLRPELILVLLSVYATFTSIATYLSFSAAVRLYMTETETEEGS